MENFISGGKVEQHPNPECRTFHMRHKLCNRSGYHTTANYIDSRGIPYLTQCVINAIEGLTGIKSTTVRQYEITVVKAEAYPWEELYPGIKLAMSKYLPATY